MDGPRRLGAPDSPPSPPKSLVPDGQLATSSSRPTTRPVQWRCHVLPRVPVPPDALVWGSSPRSSCWPCPPPGHRPPSSRSRADRLCRPGLRSRWDRLSWVRGRWLVVLGTTTYPLYLLRFDLDAPLDRARQGHVPPLVFVTAVTAAMTGLARLAHRHVERPLTALLRRGQARRSPARKPAPRSALGARWRWGGPGRRACPARAATRPAPRRRSRTRRTCRRGGGHSTMPAGKAVHVVLGDRVSRGFGWQAAGGVGSHPTHAWLAQPTHRRNPTNTGAHSISG
jgi:hypothetical protein